MLTRLKRMLVKEFLQMMRDPRMRMVVFGLPVIQMLVMAFALTTDVNRVKIAVLDRDRTPASRELLSSFTGGNYFQIVHRVQSMDEMTRLLDQGTVRAGIQIPSGFAGDIRAGRPAQVQLIADGTDSNTTAIILGYADGIVADFNGRLQGHRTGAVPVEMAIRAWFNLNQESRLYYVPALIGLMLLIFSLMLTSIGIVREKEIGTIEQVMVTPIRKMEFILGKTIPYVITGYITMTLMFILAILVFDVRIHGSILLLYGLTGIYLCGNLGLALLVSASASTQQQALLTAFFIIMPCVLLSGFMFPIHNMPKVVQYVTWVNPMRWYLEILRGVVIKGVGIKVLWPAAAAQLTLAVGFLFLASKRFRKTLS
ncbi:MAG TPA: ABC transporter permease [Syntrophales bacterium]|nr:ABC transporter permease [Syntrophales bacterium]HPQ45005.1 ABC transporter permease [Syntrophales bacterium]